jgi:hypothetical protein
MFVNQVLFLRPENVKVLGGTVEDLTNVEHLLETTQNEM